MKNKPNKSNNSLIEGTNLPTTGDPKKDKFLKWYDKSSGRAELTDSPVDYLFTGPAEASVKYGWKAVKALEASEGIVLRPIIAGGLGMPAIGYGLNAISPNKKDSTVIKNDSTVMKRTKYDGTGPSFLQTNAGGIAGLTGLATGVMDQTKFGKTKGGSALSGAASGAAAGAALGPLGMAGGAVLGAVGGLLKAKKAQEAENALEVENRFKANALLASNLPGQPTYVPTFAKGGFLTSYLYNNLNDQDNTTYYQAGGTHNQNPHGGIPIGKNALTEQGEFRYDSKTKGSYVFSNKF